MWEQLYLHIFPVVSRPGWNLAKTFLPSKAPGLRLDRAIPDGARGHHTEYSLLCPLAIFSMQCVISYVPGRHLPEHPDPSAL